MSEEKCEFYSDNKFCNCINIAREESVYHEASYCENNKNCYYKQLQTAKEENEKLRKANDEKNEFLQKLGISANGEFKRIKHYIDTLTPTKQTFRSQQS